MAESKTELRLLDGLERIVVETDEEIPVAIAIITQDGVEIAGGYRVRLKPRCD